MNSTVLAESGTACGAAGRCGKAGCRPTRAGRTRIAELYQEGAAKIRLPAVPDDPLEAILINTAGGLTGGDRIAWSIDVGAGASAMVTTQACEKVYRAGSGRAEVDVSSPPAPVRASPGCRRKRSPTTVPRPPAPP